MMREKRLRRWFVRGVIALVVVCIGCATAFQQWQRYSSCFNDRPPLRWFDVTVDKGQQALLIKQVQAYARKNNLDLGMVYYTPDHAEFLMDLTRNDVEIAASNTPFDFTLFHVIFYNNDCIHPTNASDITALVNELKAMISTVPGTKITTETSIETPMAAPTSSYP